MSERQTITVQSEDFDVGTELERMRLAVDGIGAIASFVGIVRDVNEELDVSEMTLEHYPAMTEKALNTIAEESRSRWDIIDITIVHRVGTLRPTDKIVLVAVASGPGVMLLPRASSSWIISRPKRLSGRKRRWVGAAVGSSRGLRMNGPPNDGKRLSQFRPERADTSFGAGCANKIDNGSCGKAIR